MKLRVAYIIEMKNDKSTKSCKKLKFKRAVIKCKTFIFRPCNNGIVNFSFQIITSETKTALSEKEKEENDIEDEGADEGDDEGKGKCVNVTVKPRDSENNEGYSPNSASEQEQLKGENQLKIKPSNADETETEIEKDHFVERIEANCHLHKDDEPLKPLKRGELESLGFKKTIGPDGRLRLIWTPEARERAENSPEYRQFLLRNGASASRRLPKPIEIDPEQDNDNSSSSTAQAVPEEQQEEVKKRPNEKEPLADEELQNQEQTTATTTTTTEPPQPRRSKRVRYE